MASKLLEIFSAACGSWPNAHESMHTISLHIHHTDVGVSADFCTSSRLRPAHPCCWHTPFSTPLQDLAVLQQRHGYSHVQLQLMFKRGLHPFYPPQLELQRPRFRGPIAGALASHPMAQLQTWDAWRTMRELADQLKSFLQVGNSKAPILLSAAGQCRGLILQPMDQLKQPGDAWCMMTARIDQLSPSLQLKSARTLIVLM